METVAVTARALVAMKYALIGLLYVFVAWTLATAWIQVSGRKRTKAPAPAEAPAAVPAPSAARARTERLQPSEVRVVDAGGRVLTFRLEEDPLVVGRDPGCEIVTEDQHVSGRHARLFQRKGSWFIEDLGSTNGTYLGDVKVGKAAALHAGDIARAGGTALEFHR